MSNASSKTITKTIRKWAEEREGKSCIVKGTENRFFKFISKEK